MGARQPHVSEEQVPVGRGPSKKQSIVATGRSNDFVVLYCRLCVRVFGKVLALFVRLDLLALRVRSV